jgi:O-antigen ligase
MKGLLATFALTYGGALASFVRPYWGFLIYVAFSIIKPEAQWGFALPPLRYSLTIALALLLGWAMHGFGNWRFGRGKPVVWSLGALWGICGLASAASPQPDVAFTEFVQITKWMLPFLVGATLLDSIAKVRQLAWAITLSQGFLAMRFNQQYFDGEFVESDFHYGGHDNNGHALMMAACSWLAFFLGLESKRGWVKCVAWGLAALMVHYVLFSMSRGAMLAMGASGLAAFLLLPRRASHYAILTLGALGTLWFTGPLVQKEFGTIFLGYEYDGDEAVSRFDLWRGGLSAMATRPLGVGPACFVENSAQFGLPPKKAIHSTWIQVGAETGPLGLAAVLCFFGFGQWRLLQLLRRGRDLPAEYGDFARMAVVAFVGYAVAAQFISAFAMEPPYYIQLIAVGVLRIASERRAQRPEDWLWEGESAELEHAV